VVVLGGLPRGDVHRGVLRHIESKRRPTLANRAAMILPQGCHAQGITEALGFSVHAVKAPVTVVQHECVAHRLLTAVRPRIGERGTAEQRKTKHVVDAGAAVLSVIKDCDTEARFTQIHPCMPRHLEARLVP
jgi:hypothetical protein